MSDRKVIDSETFTTKCKGQVWTGVEIIQQVCDWRCRLTGLRLASPRLERKKQCGKLRLCIVAYLPSGEEWDSQVGSWLGGCRPTPMAMDRHIIEKDADNYGQFLGWDKTALNQPILKIVLPSGDVYTSRVSDWRAGKRPTQFTMEKHLIQKEVEEEGYTFVAFGKRDSCPTVKLLLPSGDFYECLVGQWRNGARPTQFTMEKHLIQKEVEEEGYTFVAFGKQGTNPTVKLLLPSGEPAECQVSHWRNGRRPDGCVGVYNEKYFERNPAAGVAPGVIYYLKITHQTMPAFYKIGITRKASTTSRWGKRDGGYSIEILSEHSLPLYHAYRLEQDLLKTFTEQRFTPDPPLRTGNTECFSADILGLDPESPDYVWLNEAVVA